MNAGVVVDASIWVASLIQQDAFHSAAREWLRLKHTQGIDLLAPVLLLTEVAGVISRQRRNPALAHRVVEALKSLPDLTLVRLNEPLVRRATDLAADLGLRGADAFYVAVADYLKVPLATLDQQQNARAGQVVRSGFEAL